MSIQLRLPNITGKTDSEKLEQIQRYLFQLVGELQFAFDTQTKQTEEMSK